MINSGIIYAYKWDFSFRPVLIINVKKLITSKAEEPDYIMLTLFWMEHLIKDAMIPGKIENLFVIIDANEVGVTQIPKKKLEAIVGVMGNNYRGRLFWLFAVNIGVMLWALWAIVRGWID